MTSLEQLAESINIEDWETEILSWVWEQARAAGKLLLEKLDEVLLHKRGVGLVVEGLRERRVITRFGDITIRRRLYRDKSGKRHFLLDQALGLDKRSPVSSGVRELCMLLASMLPFGKCEEIVRRILPVGVSHTTIHRQLERVTEPGLVQEEKEVDQFRREGKTTPAGERTALLLFVEADGVNIALQREKERKGEIKVGIAYEGWKEASGKGRYRLKEKTVYLGMMAGDRFWDGFSLKLAKKYDLSRVERCVVGGDGAHFVRDGSEILGAMYQLDRFHLRRALLRGTGGDVSLANEVYRFCVSGDIVEADRLLMRAQVGRKREQSLEIGRLRAYLLENACGLADYRIGLGGGALRGLGAIEGNVDKLVACRMKRRGMSWTKRGAQRMARLLEWRYSGAISAWIRPEKTALTPAARTTVPGEKWRGDRSAEWLDMGVPALYGPHSNRPWVQALNSLVQGRTRS